MIVTQMMANLSVGKKLACISGLSLISMLVIGMISSFRLMQLENTTRQIAERPLPKSAVLGELEMFIRQARTRAFQHCLETDDLGWTKFEKQQSESLENAQKRMETYEKIETDPEAQRAFETIKSSWAEYCTLNARVLPLSRQGRVKEALALLNGPMKKLIDGPVEETLTGLLHSSQNEGVHLAVSAAEVSQRSRSLVLILVLAMAGVNMLLGWFITRVITYALKQTMQGMDALRIADITSLGAAVDALAQGDLTANIETTAKPLPIESRDEFGALAQTFNAMLERTRTTSESFRNAGVALRSLVGSVTFGATEVSTTSDQVSRTSGELGRNADRIARIVHEVASAVEQSARVSQEVAKSSEQLARAATEAATSMGQLDQAIGQVKEGSARQQQAARQADLGMKQAAQAVEQVSNASEQMACTARKAATVAQTGGEAVAKTVSSMGSIQQQVMCSSMVIKDLGEKGMQIGAIVETIDQIAEQTNLLALNAAIEAARAGEHGKGFAVVADEVRKLAERATGATKEIAILITSVRAGVDEAVNAMEVSGLEVSRGAAYSEEAGSALYQILSSVQEVTTDVESVRSITEAMTVSVQMVQTSVEAVRQVVEENEQSVNVMASSAGRVAGSITSVAAITQEASASAQELSASAQEVAAATEYASATVEEQTAGIEEMAASAQVLDQMASHLQELVCQFKVEDTGAQQRPTRPVDAKRLKKAA
jgi:methyl-accepting chemotaxis protein